MNKRLRSCEYAYSQVFRNKSESKVEDKLTENNNNSVSIILQETGYMEQKKSVQVRLLLVFFTRLISQYDQEDLYINLFEIPYTHACRFQQA